MAPLRAGLAVLAAMPVLAGSCRGDAPRLLRYRWEPGVPLRYKIRADIKGHLPLLGNPEPIDIEATLTIVYRATPGAPDASGATTVRYRVESADAEVAKIPFEVPMEQAQKILDREVTYASSGAVMKVGDTPPLPFALSLPSVDPQRLYCLITPVVFPAAPVGPGATWSYASPLLGDSGQNATFRATLTGLETAAQDHRATESARTPRKPHAATRGQAPAERLTGAFSMPVDQKLNKDKKPAGDGEEVVSTRKGSITGTAAYRFDLHAGRFTRSFVETNANLAEDLLGAPPTPDTPTHVETRIHAKVTIELLPSAVATTGQGVHSTSEAVK